LPASLALFPYTTLFRSRTPTFNRSKPSWTGGGRAGNGAAADSTRNKTMHHAPVAPARRTSWLILSISLNVLLVIFLVSARHPARSEEHTSELQSPDHLV